jgi:hypothetical protein
MSQDTSDSIHVNHQITLAQPNEPQFRENNIAGISEQQFDSLSPYMQNLLSEVVRMPACENVKGDNS